MRINYHTEIISNGSRGFLVPRLPAEFSMIETFLYSDVQNDEGSGKWFISIIEKVLSGISNHEEITGNTCTLEITKDYTVVTDNFLDHNRCKIDTRELQELINTWLSDKKNFRNDKK